MTGRVLAALGWALFVAALLVAWQAGVTWAGIPRYILPTPLDIVAVFEAKLPWLLRNLGVTFEEFGIGLAASVLIGAAFGIAVAQSKLFAETVYPVLVASQSVPKLALAPLFTVWFGFGLLPKVLIVFLISFFPITVNMATGLLGVDPGVLLLGRSMGFSPIQRFVKIELPSALPPLFSGLKVATAFSVVGAVIGEFLGADAGLGRVTLTASTTLDTPLLFAALCLLGLLGLIAYASVTAAERLLIPWHAPDDEGAFRASASL